MLEFVQAQRLGLRRFDICSFTESGLISSQEKGISSLLIQYCNVDIFS